MTEAQGQPAPPSQNEKKVSHFFFQCQRSSLAIGLWRSCSVVLEVATMSTKKRRPEDADSLALVPAKRPKSALEQDEGALIKLPPVCPPHPHQMILCKYF